MKPSEGIGEDLAKVLVFGLALIIGLYFVLAAALGLLFWKKPGQFEKPRHQAFILMGSVLLVLGILAHKQVEKHRWNWMEPSPLSWGGTHFNIKQAVTPYPIARFAKDQCWSVGLLLLVIPMLSTRRRLKRSRITSSDLNLATPDMGDLWGELEDPQLAPIGKSILSGETVFLAQKKRIQHVLIPGAPGQGKTTLLSALIAHAFKHRYPAIFIDAKGGSSTFEMLHRLRERLGVEPSRLKLFSLARPHLSSAYNPLLSGSPLDRKNRLIEASSWTEEHYKNVAAQALTSVFPILEKLGLPPTIRAAREIVGSPERQAEIRGTLATMLAPSESALLRDFEMVFSGANKARDFSGLVAHLSNLDDPQFGDLLSPNLEHPNQIKLSEVVAKGEIVYFQIPALGQGDTFRRLGRLILEDLKGVAREIYQGTLKNPGFCPLFIDEFGEFATKEFGVFLEQAREAGMGAHLFFQSTGQMSQIDPSFLTRIIDACGTYLPLRLGDPDSAERFSKIAGTLDAVERSWQVSSLWGGLGGAVATGAGNMRETKQMRVEHDVFKRLNTGQAVLINKSPASEDLVQIWRP